MPSPSVPVLGAPTASWKPGRCISFRNTPHPNPFLVPGQLFPSSDLLSAPQPWGSPSDHSRGSEKSSWLQLFLFTSRLGGSSPLLPLSFALAVKRSPVSGHKAVSRLGLAPLWQQPLQRGISLDIPGPGADVCTAGGKTSPALNTPHKTITCRDSVLNGFKCEPWVFPRGCH